MREEQGQETRSMRVYAAASFLSLFVLRKMAVGSGKMRKDREGSDEGEEDEEKETVQGFAGVSACTALH